MALAFLPIPSAILSIIGSSIIIYMSVSTRRSRRWTPYTRLLLCLSSYDIVGSITLGMAAFLRDKDTSPRPFSFGSSGTCSMVGFFNQLSYGTILYNGMLSFYFLLTARFGHSNAYIARVVEPWMHIISNGFPTITSVVALAIGAYGEMTHANGCWVANYPRGCGPGECTSRLIGWLYFGLPAILVFICLLINNSIICIFVRRQTFSLRNTRNNGSESWVRTGFDERNPPCTEEDGDANLDQATNKHATNDTSPEDGRPDSDQARRLHLVSTQAFLYVAFFLVCNVWTGVVGILERGGVATEEELPLVVDHYGIFVLQAILAPLNGLVRDYGVFVAFSFQLSCSALTFRNDLIQFNMFVFIRPKYHLCRMAFPGATRLWSLRRTIIGSKVQPTFASGSRSRVPNLPLVSPAAATTRLPRDMISSVTAGEGDFDYERPTTGNGDGRWTSDKVKGSSSMLVRVPLRFQSLRERPSTLGVISAHETSNIEHLSQISIVEELATDISFCDFFPNGEKRWAPDSSNRSSKKSLANERMPIPQREESTVQEQDTSNESSCKDEHVPVQLPVDQPIRVPHQRSAPGSPSVKRKAPDTDGFNRQTDQGTGSPRKFGLN